MLHLRLRRFADRSGRVSSSRRQVAFGDVAKRSLNSVAPAPPDMQTRKFLMILGLSCLCPSLLLAQRELIHPTAENMVMGGRGLKISRRDTLSSSGGLNALAIKLRGARKVDSIGTLDGDIETVLGMIRDVSIGKRGDILVLDRASRSVRAFGADGTFRFAIGREGGGPTDLRTPISVWETDAGELAVFDAALGLKFFAVAQDGAASLRKVLPATTSPTSACATAGRVYALVPPTTARGGTAGVEDVARIYDNNGKLLSTFGSAYKSPTRLVRMVMSEGEIGCVSDGNVILALSKLPFVHSYSGDGKRQWSIQLLDFAVGKNVEGRTKKGQLTIGLNPRDPTNSFTLRIRELSPGYVAIQVGLMTPESLRDRSIWKRVDTYLVESATGQAVYVSPHLPMLVGTSEGRVVGFRNDPYPQVEFLRLAQ